MGVFDRLRSAWVRLRSRRSEPRFESAVGGTESDGTAIGGNDDYDFDPDEIERRVDMLKETGHPPAEFVTALLEAEGGDLPQQAFTDYTDLSESTVSRILQDLEEDDEIVRVEIGRQKVVFLPGEAPSGVA